MIDKIKKFIYSPAIRFGYLSAIGFYNSMSDEEYLKRKFRYALGEDLDLDNPRSFNEKLQWLKIHDRNPIYTMMADKYEAKQYVAEHIGQEYIIPTIGIYEKFEEIDFERLPEQFVLKCTHDSGGLVVCKDKNKLDIGKAKKKICKSLKRNYYYWGREYPYKDIKPRIIVEKYIEDEYGKDINDYKLMCFNGKVKCTFVCSERFGGGLKVTFFDNDWKVLPFERHYPKSNEIIERPRNFRKMIEIAEVLSKDIPFLRVDFYEVGSQIYFGELTFFPGSGFEEFSPKEWDKKLGDWINLEPIKYHE